MKKDILSENALKIAKSRYFIDDDESWEELAQRIARVAASVENGARTVYTNNFAEMISEMDFLPGGRILRNIGRPRGSLFNCYVLPCGDSIEEIGQYIKDSLILWSEGGGVGVNVSHLRPRGAIIRGKGGNSSGPVSFLEAANAVSKTIESGGSRRAAALAGMHVSHPDILEFIDAKLVHGKLDHFNLSVAIDDKFLEAVEADGEWQFKFAQQNYGKIQAKTIWDKIIENMVSCAEPGLLHWGNLTSNNSYYFDPILSTNPCVVGDTLVAVADGRDAVSIKQLADEGKDVPVFCTNDDGAVTVKTMRNPRITGRNKKTLKITLSDGSVFKCTHNHKILIKNGIYKRADNLVVGDKLVHSTKYKLINKRASNKKTPYWFWHLGGFNGFHKSEHRIVYEASNGSVPENYIIHHKDFDSLNNKLENLEAMRHDTHSSLHSSLGCVGEDNGRYLGISPCEVFDSAVLLSKSLNRRITKDEWNKHCKENSLPYSKYSIGNYKSHSLFLKAASLKAGVYTYNSSAEALEYRKYLKLINETDLDIFFNDGIYVRKACEFCGASFVVKWSKREQCFCSVKCSNLSRDYSLLARKYYVDRQEDTRFKQLNIFTDLCSVLNREPLKIEWENKCKELLVPFRLMGQKYNVEKNPHVFRTYGELKEVASDNNFTIVSIEEDGCEDVYNGTVEDFHNFVTIVNNGDDKKSGIISMNCGEVPLASYGVCDLGSLVLPHFITGNINTNWRKLEKSVKLAVRLLDNIIDVNKYVLKNIEIKAHNARRVGLGVMGLAEYLFAKKLRYGSKKAIYEVERLMRFIRDTAYEASVELAIEKGAFPKFDAPQYGKAHFIRSLPASLRIQIKKHGTRNVTLMAMAPTGTISLLPEVSSGIEPLFRKAYKRSDRVSDRIYVHPLYEKSLKEADEPIDDWFVDTDDLTPSDHFETQVAVQKFTDGAVSKTINMPSNTTTEDLSTLTMEYIYDLKGVTVYVDGSREGQILNKVSEETVRTYLESGNMDNNIDEETTKCATGSCEI